MAWQSFVSDQILLDIYKQALEIKLDNEFIQEILEEIKNRKLPLYEVIKFGNHSNQSHDRL